jgi:hypothetical protein
MHTKILIQTINENYLGVTMKDILEAQLKKYNLSWCKGECGKTGHKRGFVLAKDKTTIHLDSKVQTRRSLHRALHEIGHCVNDETGLRSYQKEQNAEKFAKAVMKEYGISVSRKMANSGKRYVARKKRHGDNIKKGRGAI